MVTTGSNFKIVLKLIAVTMGLYGHLQVMVAFWKLVLMPWGAGETAEQVNVLVT